LKEAHIERLLDVRLNNVSQLAAFSKRDDLQYFLRTICGAEYEHALLLAPTAEMREAYNSKDITFNEYADAYASLLASRKVELALSPDDFRRKRTVFLCSEHSPERCHRRVAVEYLNSKWGNVQAIHL
jgi:uncharacterized protein (DUF488 family)